MKKNKKIGIFDSGIGGLTILDPLIKAFPYYEYVYLADNAFAPYGKKSHGAILARTRKVVDFLKQQDCALVISACNSASSTALRVIQSEYNSKHFRVLGILVPTAEAAASIPQNTRVGILATEATVNSGAYVREVTKVLPDAEVFQSSAPGLATAIEEGAQAEDIDAILQKNLTTLLGKNLTSLILSCTHYELALDHVKKIAPKYLPIITSGGIIADKLKTYLENHSEIASQLSHDSNARYCITDAEKSFPRPAATLQL